MLRIRTFLLSLISLALMAILPVLTLVSLSIPSEVALAQGPPNPIICYSVADGGDMLHSMDRFTGVDLGGRPNQTDPYDQVEAIELSLDNLFLWAIDDTTDTGGTGQFGVIDQVTGVFTPIGTGIGLAGNTVLGTRNVGDGDGLSIDARTNQLWALEQTGGTTNNAIFRVDPATGSHVNDVFGTGFDYAIIDLRPANLPSCSGGAGCTPGVNCPNTIDDLAIHPEDGTFYAIVNDINAPTVDWLARLNVDGRDPANSPGFNPATGLVSACLVGILNDGTNNVTDMEGFGVFNDGTFYGTTGSESIIATQRNTMWQIDVTTAHVTRIGTFLTDTDYESVACITAGANVMTGTVFCEPPSGYDGVFNTGDTPQANATLRLYLDRGTPDQLDGSDILIQETTTGASGTFSFSVGMADTLLIVMDGAIIPVGSVYTTPLTPGNVHEVDFLPPGGPPFTGYNNTSSGNDFGFTCQAVSTTADLSIAKSDAPDPVAPGGDITYTIAVNSVGNAAATNGVMNDALPAGTTFVSLSAPAGWSCTTPAVGSGGTVNCTNPSVAVGGPYTFTLVVNVPASYAGPNPIPNTATTGADNDANTANNSASTTTALTTAPPEEADLAIAKSDAPDPITPGNNLIYTINVANVGAIAAVNSVMNDTLPAGTTFVSLSAPAGWACTTPAVGSGGTVSCTNPSVAVGGPYPFSLTVAVPADYAGPNPIPNTATTGADNDANLNNNSASTITSLPGGQPTGVTLVDPALSKVGVLQPGGRGVIGERVTWVITATNPNSVPLTGVVVSDTIRADLRVDGASTAVGTAAVSGQQVTFNLGTLAPGQVVEMRIETTIISGPQPPITNLAILTADGGLRVTAYAEVFGFPTLLPATGYPPNG